MHSLSNSESIMECIRNSLVDSLQIPGETFELSVIMRHTTPHTQADGEITVRQSEELYGDFRTDIRAEQAMDLMDYIMNLANEQGRVVPDIGLDRVQNVIRDNFDRGNGDTGYFEHMARKLIYSDASYIGLATKLTVTVDDEGMLHFNAETLMSIRADTSDRDRDYLNTHDMGDLVLPQVSPYMLIPFDHVSTSSLAHL